jgi:hypothetical protein
LKILSRGERETFFGSKELVLNNSYFKRLKAAGAVCFRSYSFRGVEAPLTSSKREAVDRASKFSIQFFISILKLSEARYNSTSLYSKSLVMESSTGFNLRLASSEFLKIYSAVV